MPSFDVVSETDMQEVDNAVNQSVKEIGTRYDFRNSKCEITLEDTVITVVADDDYKREQVLEVLKSKMVRRSVDLRTLSYGKVEPASQGKVRQKITVLQGIETDLAKKIIKDIKESKLKVQAAIQERQVRITAKQRDDLQETIGLLKKNDYDIPLQFVNFRE